MDIEERLQDIHDKLIRLLEEMHKRVVGQDEEICLMLYALLAGRSSHVLLEGVPGTAKTLLLSTLAQALHLSFSRIQFNAGLMPGDLTGSEIYNPKTGEIEFVPGPIMANFVLADEINRAPAKTVSALLEAMQEGQVTTVYSGTMYLPPPFMLFATQNPIEHEGTYELPDAQVDRLLMKIIMDYTTHEESMQIVEFNTSSPESEIEEVMDGEAILGMRSTLEEPGAVHIDNLLKHKIVSLVELTRPETSDIAREADVKLGASARAQIALTRVSRVLAVSKGRDFVLPQDIMYLAGPILRHRIIFNSESVMEEEESESFENLLQEIFRRLFTDEFYNDF